MTEMADMSALPVIQAAGSTDLVIPERRLAWFIIHTYSGYEAKVMTHLRQRVKMEERDEHFGDIQIPEETYEEMKIDAKSGRKERVIKKRKSFPGYLLVQIAGVQKGHRFEMEDADWHLVRNTEGDEFVAPTKSAPHRSLMKKCGRS